MSELIDENPEYAETVIMRLDWNTQRKDPIVRELRIPRRSTLVMFQGGEEVGRVVAQTSTDAIDTLFMAAFAQ